MFEEILLDENIELYTDYYKKYGKRKSYFLCEMQNPKTREQFKLMFWTFLIVGSFFLIYIIFIK